MKQDENKKLTLLSEIGEFGVISRIEKNVKQYSEDVIKGIGDDCAVIKKNDTTYTIVSTDMLVEGIHFRLSYSPLKHLGYKAAMVNFSDIFAMNGKPEQLLVSISISNKLSLESIEEFYEGINLACKRFNVDLVGGDTTSSQSGFTISITAIGSVEKNKICYRSGAKENDLICISGNIGASYIGLLFLEREHQIFNEHPANFKPDLKGKEYVVERQLKPEARGDIISKLNELKIIPTSMIDISDGLSSELLHISKMSAVGCTVYEDKIPIDDDTVKFSKEFNISPLTPALNGGEDYEIMFTINQKDYKKIKEIKNVNVIGHITHKSVGNYIVTKDYKQFPLEAQGWKQF